MALYAFDGTGNEDQELDERDSNVVDFFSVVLKRIDDEGNILGASDSLNRAPEPCPAALDAQPRAGACYRRRRSTPNLLRSRPGRDPM